MTATAQQPQVRMSDLLSGFSLALDLVMGQPMEHCVRSAYMSMRLAEKVGLSDREKQDLFYASLLKDSG
jgi:HD-GYP domain-containing protein (c-di-GMP phosphodiesterase class II)